MKNKLETTKSILTILEGHSLKEILSLIESCAKATSSNISLSNFDTSKIDILIKHNLLH